VSDSKKNIKLNKVITSALMSPLIGHKLLYK
jgi:hypothetical protein